MTERTPDGFDPRRDGAAERLGKRADGFEESEGENGRTTGGTGWRSD